jgi:predicted nucleotidyltransferase
MIDQDSSVSTRLEGLCERFELLAIYLTGSRKDDGLRHLQGLTVEPSESDLDVGVVFLDKERELGNLGALQAELGEIFGPFSVDLILLDRVDTLFQASAIDGHRLATLDSHRADLHELAIFRRAAELLPVQRQIEKDLYGVVTS